MNVHVNVRVQIIRYGTISPKNCEPSPRVSSNFPSGGVQSHSSIEQSSFEAKLQVCHEEQMLGPEFNTFEKKSRWIVQGNLWLVKKKSSAMEQWKVTTMSTSSWIPKRSLVIVMIHLSCWFEVLFTYIFYLFAADIIRDDPVNSLDAAT